jgi:glycosyltransferase involved in cell wall biosynthesis
MALVNMRHTLAALRALVVLPYPPLPEGGAAARCAVALLRGLQEQGLEAQALAASIGPSSEESMPVDLDVELVRIESPSVWEGRLDRLVRPGGRLARGEFALRVRELSAQADVVHFVEPQAAAALAHARAPALTQLHFYTRRDRSVGAPWRREGRDAIELLRAERRICRDAHWLLANSSEVAAELASHAPNARISVAPLALDGRYYSPRATLESATAGLIGTASWPPTAKAVERLLLEVWPLVHEHRPRARLLLAGEGMERSRFSHLPDCPGVEWHGRVPSAAEFLRELGLLVYPLTAGSGVKVKVLEALALGVPVVTTPDGAEGLGGGGGVTVESDNSRIVEAVLALLDEHGARQEIGNAAYQTFTAYHTPKVAAIPVVQLYERMLA